MAKPKVTVLTIFDLDVYREPNTETYEVSFAHMEQTDQLGVLLKICQDLQKNLPKDEEMIGIVMRSKKDSIPAHHNGVVIEKDIQAKKFVKKMKKKEPTRVIEIPETEVKP